jgi:hypothetical protein
MHIDEGESTCSIHSGQQDRVGVAHDSEMLGICCYPGLQPPDSVVGRRPESLPCLIS